MGLETVFAGTGHRLEIVGPGLFELLTEYAQYILPSYNPTQVISGMAQGWDQAIALAAINLKIPLIAAVPFKGQENVWTQEAQMLYTEILECATEIVIVSEGGYASKKYQIRDEWMVDHAGGVIALWNGHKHGGTYNTVKYTEKVKKPVHNVWPGWESFKLTTYEQHENALTFA